MKLTTAVVRNFKAPPGVPLKNVSDDAMKGFYVRFRASGAHTYAVCYGPKTSRNWHKIADVGAMTLEQARAAGKEVLARIALGANPLAEKAKARIEAQNTFGALIEPFVAHKRNGRRKSTVDEIERYLNNATSLHRLPVKEIDRAVIAALLTDVEKTRGPGARNNMRNYLSSFLGWMRGEGYIDINVALSTNTAARKARARLLTDDEAQMILTALDQQQRVDADFRDIVKLLFLTGLRRTEVAELAWREIDFDQATIIIVGERMKNHREHLVPMSDAVLGVLRERYTRLDPGDVRSTVFGRRDTGFSGFSKAKRQLDQVITELNNGKPIEWILHDIRRYVSTLLNETCDVAPHVVEVVLAHYPKGVAGTYNRSAYVTEKRRALDKLAAHLHAVTSGEAPEAKVVNLGKRLR